LGVTLTLAQGINNAGQIVGQYENANVFHGFLLSGGTYTTLDGPSAINFTVANGINDAGQIVGFYSNASGNHGFLLTITPNPPPPAGTTADMILRGSNASPIVAGQYEIYDIGNNAILAGYQLGQVGPDWQFSGLGGVGGGNSTMLLRNAGTGGFELYGINNIIITAAFLGTVGLDWQFAGFGDFSSRGESDHDPAQRQYRRIAGLRHRQQPDHRYCLLGAGRPGLAGRRLRQFFEPRHERHDHAQQRERRIAGLRHRPQSNQRFGLPGHGGIGLADHRRRQFQQHAGRKRRDHAQHHDRRIAGLRHRQQPDHRLGLPWHSGVG